MYLSLLFGIFSYNNNFLIPDTLEQPISRAIMPTIIEKLVVLQLKRKAIYHQPFKEWGGYDNGFPYP